MKIPTYRYTLSTLIEMCRVTLGDAVCLSKADSYLNLSFGATLSARNVIVITAEKLHGVLVMIIGVKDSHK